MRNYLFFPFLLVLSACSGGETPDHRLTAPAGQLTFALLPETDDVPLQYQITRKLANRIDTIVFASRLGLELSTSRFTSDLQLRSTSPVKLVQDEYTLFSGKQTSVKESGNERIFTLINPADEQLLVEVRAYDNGIAFRYRLITPDSIQRRLTAELTTFNLPAGDFWAQPYDTIGQYYPAYEAYYANGIPTGTPAPSNKNGWALPVLIRTDQTWILLHESGVNATNAGTHLDADPSTGGYTVAYPEQTEMFNKGAVYPTFSGAWASPWRVLTIGDLATITESTLVTTLAADNQLDNTDWIHPGRAAWSWASAPDSPQDYDLLTPFIDLCADFGWEYFLEDANWDRMQNGDLAQLVSYAEAKGVGLWVWYNSGGPHNVVTEAPRGRMMPDQRRAEMQMLKRIGVKGIKVDFFHS
ncbi:MAG: glycoside hydrolase family 97 N-terminal domain-containing protein, partial [Bacteroidota bacterium]